jgi:hypothetical protein
MTDDPYIFTNGHEVWPEPAESVPSQREKAERIPGLLRRTRAARKRAATDPGWSQKTAEQRHFAIELDLKEAREEGRG